MMKITDQDIINALIKVAAKYGNPFAARLEQLFRNETAHFKSDQFIICLSPGMQAVTNELPYGWTGLADFWKLYSGYAPTGIHIENENTSALAKASGAQKFMIFPTIEASMMSVAFNIKLHDNNFGAWFSTNPDLQKKYVAILDTIIPRFVNANVQ